MTQIFFALIVISLAVGNIAENSSWGWLAFGIGLFLVSVIEGIEED